MAVLIIAFGAPAPQWISLKSGQAGERRDRNRGEKRRVEDETGDDKDGENRGGGRKEGWRVAKREKV